MKKNGAGQITVKGKDIPDFMPAMTMRYDICGSGVCKEFQLGDLISAEVVVAPDEKSYWLDDIRITHAAARDRERLQILTLQQLMARDSGLAGEMSPRVSQVRGRGSVEGGF